MIKTKLDKENLTVNEFTQLIKDRQALLENGTFFMPILINVSYDITTKEFENILKDIRLASEIDFAGEFMYMASVNIIVFIVTKINTFSKQILKNKLIVLANTVNEIFNTHLKCSSSVIIGNSYSKAVDMVKNIRELLKISKYYLFTNTNYIFRQDILDINQKISKRYAEKVCTQISYYIERLEYKLAINEIDKLFSKIAEKYDVDTLTWVKHHLFAYFTLGLHSSNLNIEQLEPLYPDYNAKTCSRIKFELITVINNLADANKIKKVDNITTIQKAVAYIEEHFDNPITLEQVSQDIGVSREHICRLFSSQYGCSFVEYVNNYRINKAKEYFFTKQYNVSKVSEMVGFSSSKYFCTIFKSIVGITPKQFQMDSRKYAANN